MDPIEIERKFIIEYPREEVLLKNAERRIRMEQTYLTGTGDGQSRRIRKSEENGKTTYTTTEKHRIDALQRVEIEREISEEEYCSLQKESDPERNVIYKTRWCVPISNGLTAEIDVFDGFTDYAYCEVELPSPEQVFSLPDFVSVIQEATEDHRFSNSALSLYGFPSLTDEN